MGVTLCRDSILPVIGLSLDSKLLALLNLVLARKARTTGRGLMYGVLRRELQITVDALTSLEKDFDVTANKQSKVEAHPEREQKNLRKDSSYSPQPQLRHA
jgi:hypothetical protein